MRSNPHELTWRQMRQQRPLLIKLFSGMQLQICIDRLKLPCERIERMEALREWAETQKRRHCSKGMMVYPVREREE